MANNLYCLNVLHSAYAIKHDFKGEKSVLISS